MTRILDATCVDNVVRVAGHVVTPTPTIITQGKRSSSGILIMEGDRATYVATNTADIEDFLQKTNDALSAITSALGTISSSLTAIAASDGSLGLIATIAANVAAISSNSSTISSKASEMITMKGNLK